MDPAAIGELAQPPAIREQCPAIAWRIKEMLRWIRKAESVKAARWRITHFLRHASQLVADDPILDPVRKALTSFDNHLERILQRWTSAHSTRLTAGNRP